MFYIFFIKIARLTHHWSNENATRSYSTTVASTDSTAALLLLLKLNNIWVNTNIMIMSAATQIINAILFLHSRYFILGLTYMLFTIKIPVFPWRYFISFTRYPVKCPLALNSCIQANVCDVLTSTFQLISCKFCLLFLPIWQVIYVFWYYNVLVR